MKSVGILLAKWTKKLLFTQSDAKVILISTYTIDGKLGAELVR